MKAKKDFPTIDYAKLKDRLNKIEDARDRVLIKTIYAGCARVGEIARNRYHNDWIAFGYSAMSITPKILVLNLVTEKTLKNRRVPISRITDITQLYFKNNEAWLTEDLIAYYSAIPTFKWDIGTRRAEQLFAKYFPEYGNHIHYLRHWRATHLRQGAATGVPLPLDFVKKIGGWSSVKVPEQTYEHSVIEDFIKMEE